MEQEAAYLAALQRTARFDVAPDALVLRDDTGGVLLRFAPQPQTPLEGTTWSAQAYNNGRGGVVSLIAGTEITARFEAGRVGGSAGCNTYTASYTLNGSAIEIGPAISTRMACQSPPGRMEQEAAYLAALQTARVYRIEGSRLTLETADGAGSQASFPPPACALLMLPPWPLATAARRSVSSSRRLTSRGLTGPRTAGSPWLTSSVFRRRRPPGRGAAPRSDGADAARAVGDALAAVQERKCCASGARTSRSGGP